MSTRCRIGKEMPNGEIKSIYCHFDGYPDGVGETLKKHYTNPDKIDALLELGDISSLGEDYDAELAKKSWTAREKGENLTEEEQVKIAKMTIPYRDRGETGIEARIDDNEWQYLENIGKCSEDYTYLFKEDYTGVYKWHIVETPYFKELE